MPLLKPWRSLLIGAIVVLAVRPSVTLAQAASQTTPAQSPPASTTVQGVVVDGARASTEPSIDRRSYSTANDLQAATGSLADVLRDIPSVQVDLQGKISLRGDQNVTVLVDGKPSAQFSGENLAQMLQAMPANQVDRIEVITNPSAEFRADGSGGIINLIMKRAKGAGRTGAIRAQAATSGRGLITGNVGYNSNRLSTTADFSARLDHQVQTMHSLQTTPDPQSGVLDDNQDVNRGHLTQSVANAHMGADFDLSAQTRLSGAVRLSYIHADLPSLDLFAQDDDAGALASSFRRLSSQHATQYNDEASTTLRHTWSEGRDLVLTAIYAGMQYRRDRLDVLMPTLPLGAAEADLFNRHTHSNRATFMADYQTPMSGQAKLKLGYDFEYSAAVFEHAAASDAAGTGLAPVADDTGGFLDEEMHNQAYVTYERPFGKLDAQLGLRGDLLHLDFNERPQNDRSNQDYGALYPSLHLSYDLTNMRKLAASYSRRVDRPPYGLLDPIPYPQNPGFEIVGNRSLRPQNTDSFELTFESRKDASSLLATLYYR